MVDRLNRPAVSAGSWAAPSPVRPAERTGKRPEDFASVLFAHLSSVRFSSHASERLQSRGIRLEGDTLRRLERALDLAAAKGARNALVVVDDVALVVSVVNRTVVTAMPKDPAEANVFTNIDSAVLT